MGAEEGDGETEMQNAMHIFLYAYMNSPVSVCTVHIFAQIQRDGRARRTRVYCNERFRG